VPRVFCKRTVVFLPKDAMPNLAPCLWCISAMRFVWYSSKNRYAIMCLPDIGLILSKEALMKTIGLKDPFSAKQTYDAERDVTFCTVAVRPSAADNAPRFVVDFSLNWENVSEEEIKELAARTLVIDVQRNFRVAYQKDRGTASEKIERSWSVREMLDASRPKSDPVSKVLGVLNKLSVEERKAILAKLQASSSEE
jgi:hypothetical protein